MSGPDFWPQRPGRGHGGARPQPPRSAARDNLQPTRPGRTGEVALAACAPEAFDRLILALMRCYFQTFAAPETHGWLIALRIATAHVGPRRAGALCHDVVAVVQALRTARSTPVQFNPESCACCRVWLSPEERRLLDLFAALRDGRTGRARALVQLLCDGAPDDDLLAMVEACLRHRQPQQG